MISGNSFWANRGSFGNQTIDRDIFCNDSSWSKQHFSNCNFWEVVSRDFGCYETYRFYKYQKALPWRNFRKLFNRTIGTEGTNMVKKCPFLDNKIAFQKFKNGSRVVFFLITAGTPVTPITFLQWLRWGL